MTNPNDENDFIIRRVEHTINDLFADIQRFHDQHVKPMRELAQEAGARPDHVEQLELTWDRVIRTQQNVLLRLSGVPVHAGKPAQYTDYPEGTGALGNPLPTEELVAQLTADELVEAIEACELSLADCRRAVRSLQTRDGSGPADYWMGASAPSHLFAEYAQWFEGALGVLRRLRQHRALADHRAATQFQPLDEASPTVSVLLRLPERLRDEVDAAAQAAGLSRSEAIRAALRRWLDESA